MSSNYVPVARVKKISETVIIKYNVLLKQKKNGQFDITFTEESVKKTF